MGTSENKEFFQKYILLAFAVMRCATRNDNLQGISNPLPIEIDSDDIGNNLFSQTAVKAILYKLVLPLDEASKTQVRKALSEFRDKYSSTPDDILEKEVIEILSSKKSANSSINSANSSSNSSKRVISGPITLWRVIALCLLAVSSVDAWNKFNVWNYVPTLNPVDYVVPHVLKNPENAASFVKKGLVLLADHDKANIADIVSYTSSQIAHMCGLASGGLWLSAAAAALTPGAQPLVPFLSSWAISSSSCMAGFGISTFATNVANIGLRTTGHLSGIAKLPDGLVDFAVHKGADMATKVALAKTIDTVTTGLRDSVFEVIETSVGAAGSKTENVIGALNENPGKSILSTRNGILTRKERASKSVRISNTSTTNVAPGIYNPKGTINTRKTNGARSYVIHNGIKYPITTFGFSTKPAEKLMAVKEKMIPRKERTNYGKYREELIKKGKIIKPKHVSNAMYGLSDGELLVSTGATSERDARRAFIRGKQQEQHVRNQPDGFSFNLKLPDLPSTHIYPPSNKNIYPPSNKTTPSLLGILAGAAGVYASTSAGKISSGNPSQPKIGGALRRTRKNTKLNRRKYTQKLKLNRNF